MNSFFPWRLFWKLTITLAILFNLVFISALSLSALFLNFELSRTEPLFLWLSFFVMSLVASVAFAYRFSSPLKRVILKALRMASKKNIDESQEVEIYLQDEPGEYFELEIALDKIRKKMKKRRIQLMNERAESQALMLSLDDAILSVDEQLRMKFFNSKFANLFLTRSQADELTFGERLPITQIFREPYLLTLFESCLSENSHQSQILTLNSKIDNMNRDFQVKVSPLRDPKSGEVFSLMALFHDVTEIKKAEKIRIEFVENASHELRTPLTSMKGFVETVKEDVQMGRLEQVPHFLQIISRGVDRLSELVNDMLTLSSLENKVSLKKEMIDPFLVTQEVLQRMASLAEQKSIMIKMSVDATEFMADSGKVEQVIQNLVDNAIKYIQDHGQIEVRWVEADGMIKLHVIDNGPGLAEDHIGRVFERFYRIDKGRSRDVGGTGLGLSIVKHIMQSHGGSVKLNSQVGKGSEFICSFPKFSV